MADFTEMKKLTDVCMARGYKVLHLTFHSSMCSAGDSIYSRNKKERDMRLKNLQDIVDYLINEKKIRCYTASEIYEDWNKNFAIQT